jgi:hypothetical protein
MKQEDRKACPKPSEPVSNNNQVKEASVQAPRGTMWLTKVCWYMR